MAMPTQRPVPGIPSPGMQQPSRTPGVQPTPGVPAPGPLPQVNPGPMRKTAPALGVLSPGGEGAPPSTQNATFSLSPARGGYGNPVQPPRGGQYDTFSLSPARGGYGNPVQMPQDPNDPWYGYGESEQYRGFDPSRDPGMGGPQAGTARDTWQEGQSDIPQPARDTWREGPSAAGWNENAPYDPGNPAWNKTFSLSDIAKDPGYQFMLDEARRNADAQNAASGRLYSGGALDEAVQRATGLAGTHANEAYDRFASERGFGQGEDQRRFANTQADTSGRFGRYESGRDFGAGETGRRFGRYESGRNFNADQTQTGFRNRQDEMAQRYGRYESGRNFNANQGNTAASSYQDALDRAYGRFGGERNARTNERQRLFGNMTSEDQRQFENARAGGNDQWNRYMGLANLGYGATGQLAGYDYNTGAAGAEGMLGAGNAEAAGTVGGANADQSEWDNNLQDLGDYWDTQGQGPDPYTQFGQNAQTRGQDVAPGYQPRPRR